MRACQALSRLSESSEQEDQTVTNRFLESSGEDALGKLYNACYRGKPKYPDAA